MTHAYDKVCLDRAADTLGRMLDYSVYTLHYDIAAMIDLFIASGTASLFERGDIRVTAGMSGVELSYEVLEKSGIAFERNNEIRVEIDVVGNVAYVFVEEVKYKIIVYKAVNAANQGH